MQTYDFNTGNQGTLVAAGTLVAYVSGNALGLDDGIIIRPERGGSAVELQPGQSFTFTERFQQLRIAARTQAVTVAGKILVGEGSFTNNRVGGDVNVIDGGKNRTLANQAFWAYAGQTAGAGVLPIVMLFNPSNSSTRTIVKQIRVASPTASFISIGIHNAVLADGPFNVRSKLANGANAAAKMYRDNLAASPATNIESVSVAANIPTTITFTEPVVLPPGFGLMAWNQTLGTSLTMALECSEEAAV